jgi:hypothetical protein
MGSRRKSTTGLRALYLELIHGIRKEMIKAGIQPSAMADKLIAAAPQIHPELVEELDHVIGDDDDLVGLILPTTPKKKRIADRLGLSKPARDEWTDVSGRMVACHALYGEKMKHFTD